MSVVKMDGIKVVKKELEVFDLVSRNGTFFKQHGNRKVERDRYIMAPPLLNDSFYRPVTSMVKPCKPDPFSLNKVIRTPPMRGTDNMVPKFGYAKHQPKGLAYDKVFGSMNRPNPPITNFFEANKTKRPPH